jgi:hypothetical protein
MIIQVLHNLFKYELGSIHCSFMLYIYWCGIVLKYLGFLKQQIDSSVNFIKRCCYLSFSMISLLFTLFTCQLH